MLRLRSWTKKWRLCYFSTLTFIVAEAASISLCTLSFCFPLTAISLCPFQRWHSSSFESLPIQMFQFFGFWREKFVSWCWCLFTMVSSFWKVGIDRFLVRTLPILFWVDKTLVFASYPKFARILSFGTSLIDNKTSSHLASKSWILLQCKVIRDRSENQERLHEPVTWKYS